MFNTMMKQIKEIALNEAVGICDKTQFMDTTLFYNRIKDMTVEEITNISMSIVMAYHIKELNKGLKITKHESIIKMVM